MNKEVTSISIIGQRRSGTSMVSGILYNLGISVESNNEIKSSFNPKGFFEDKNFVDISRKILKFTYNSYFPLIFENTKILDKKNEIIETYGKEIEKVIRKRMNSIWAFKDVNQVITYPIFQNFIQNPKYIIVLRNPLSIARSYRRWHPQLNLNSILLKVISQEHIITNFIKDNKYPIFITSYEDILRDKDEFILSLIKFLNISPDNDKIKKAHNFIDPSIRNF